MKNIWGAAVAALTAWLGACTPAAFAPPAKGGATWSQITTPHFTLYTDVPVETARETALGLEGVHNVLEDVAFPFPRREQGRIDATYFQTHEAFLELTRSTYLLSYTGRESRDPDRKPMMVFTGNGAAIPLQGNTPVTLNLRHQLVHRLLAYYLPAAPTWLNEGLASFYETLEVPYGGSEGQVRVGGAPDSFPFQRGSTARLNIGGNDLLLSRDEVPGAAAVVTADADFLRRPDPDPGLIKAKSLFRTASWNLVRTMLLGAPPLKAAFAQYLDALAKGADPRAAWAAALRNNGITAERLEADYKKTLERWPQDAESRAYAPRPPAKPEARPMTEAEVHLLWARVRPWRPEHLPRVGSELDAAVKADPNLMPAYLVRGEWRLVTQGAHADVLADLRKAAALAPDDARTSYALARYLDYHARKNPAAKAEVEGELRPLVEALRQKATSAAALNLLALYDGREGQTERALPSAQKAISADPTCFECYDTAALLLYRLGRLDEAVATERTGVNLLPEGAIEPEMVKRLLALKQELAARPSPGAAPARPSPDAAPPPPRGERARRVRARPTRRPQAGAA